MKQYLLAVHTDYGQPPPPEEEMQQAYESVDAFNAELKSAGAWVFAGGLHPAFGGHGRSQPGRQGDHDRRAVLGDEGAAGGLLGDQGPGPGQRTRLGGQGLRGLRQPGGGPAVSG